MRLWAPRFSLQRLVFWTQHPVSASPFTWPPRPHVRLRVQIPFHEDSSHVRLNHLEDPVSQEEHVLGAGVWASTCRFWGHNSTQSRTM